MNRIADYKPDEVFLSVKQVAETLAVSNVQVTRYHLQGLLPFVVRSTVCGRYARRLTPLSALRSFVRPKPGPKPNGGME